MDDLISRQQAIDALMAAIDDVGVLDGADIKTVFDMLPSVQHENAQLSQEDTTSDMISRTATIDAVNNAFDRETLLTGFVRSIAVRAIRDMPSAQPEPHEGHWIRTDCGLDVECKCSVCGYKDFVEPHDTYWFKRNYCPNCGARMKGERQK
jgi:hypothetical protein